MKWYDKPAPRWFTYAMHCLLMVISPRRERLRWAVIQREWAGQRLNKTEEEREAFREKLRQSLNDRD